MYPRSRYSPPALPHARHGTAAAAPGGTGDSRSRSPVSARDAAGERPPQAPEMAQETLRPSRTDAGQAGGPAACTRPVRPASGTWPSSRCQAAHPCAPAADRRMTRSSGARTGQPEPSRHLVSRTSRSVTQIRDTASQQVKGVSKASGPICAGNIPPLRFAKPPGHRAGVRNGLNHHVRNPLAAAGMAWTRTRTSCRRRGSPPRREVGPSLRFASAKVAKASRSRADSGAPIPPAGGSPTGRRPTASAVLRRKPL